MDNVPVRVNGQASSARQADAPNEAGKSKKPKKRLKRLGWLAGITAMLLVLALGGWLVYKSSMAATIDGGRYQAVFFTNGQVYFGKLSNLNGDYFKLTDVFYLQTKKDETSNPQETGTQDDNNVELVKLGSEIHGPDDSMIISKDQVLFFENLKKDGTVTNSIDKYVGGNK